MNLLESLKAAKPHLSRSRRERGYKTAFICFAICDAYCEKYGQAVEYGAVHAQLNTAKQYVGSKLRKLQQELGVPSAATFDLATARAYMREDNPDRQQARHRWLDSLITELEQWHPN